MRLLACLFSRSSTAVRVTQTVDPHVLLLERDNPQQGLALDFDQLECLTELYREIRNTEPAHQDPPSAFRNNRLDDGPQTLRGTPLSREDR